MRPDRVICTHPRRMTGHTAKGICGNCGRTIFGSSRYGGADRPHLVNGYALSDSDYELVMGYRRERDRQIAAAKNGYNAKLRALLELVKKG